MQINPLDERFPRDVCVYILLQLSCFDLRKLCAVNRSYQDLIENHCYPILCAQIKAKITPVTDVEFVVGIQKGAPELGKRKCGVCKNECTNVPCLFTVAVPEKNMNTNTRFCADCAIKTSNIKELFERSTLLVYALNYNYLRISEGMGALQYSN